MTLFLPRGVMFGEIAMASGTWGQAVHLGDDWGYFAVAMSSAQEGQVRFIRPRDERMNFCRRINRDHTTRRHTGQRLLIPATPLRIQTMEDRLPLGIRGVCILERNDC